MLIADDWTVGRIKQALQDKEGPPVCHQRLSYMGRVLNDEATVKGVGMKVDSCLKLEFGLRGGGGEGSQAGTPAKGSGWNAVSRSGSKKKPEAFSVATPDMVEIKDDKDKAMVVVDKDLDQKLTDWKEKKSKELRSEVAAKAKGAVKAMEIPRPDIMLPGGSEKMKLI